MLHCPATLITLFGWFCKVALARSLLQSNDRPAAADVVGNKYGYGTTEALCTAYGLQPRPDVPEPMIYDFFLSGYEPDMVEIRLRELEALVHTFIAVESRVTFSNTEKPLTFPAVLQRLPARVIDKARYVVLDSLHGVNNWGREKQHRDALFERGLQLLGVRPEPHDILLVSDADEIPKPAFLYALKHCSGAAYPLSMESRLTYYSFGRALELGKEGSIWHLGPKAVLAGQQLERHISASELRGMSSAVRYPNTSWHCSTCFCTVAAIQHKMRSFSHSAEWDTPANQDPATIVERVRTGDDVFGRLELWGPHPFMKLPVVDMPSFVVQHPARFAYLMDRDTPDAGFTDLMT